MPETEAARRDVLDILGALEFGTRKEERELLDGVFSTLGLRRRLRKAAVADDVLEGPGFEAFLFEVLRAVRPFAQMLREVYGFLNRAQAITRRRASMFRVSAAGARAQLDFSLDHFPRELLSVLTEVESKTAVVELRFPGLDLATGSPVEWLSTAVSFAWHEIAPNWDGDFFDSDNLQPIGFHRLLSYARRLLPEGDEASWSRLRALAEPLLDRLAAIVLCADSIEPLKLEETRLGGWHGEDFRFRPTLPEVRAHRVRCDEARATLLLPTRTQPWNEQRRHVIDELHSIVYGAAISIHLFRKESIRRELLDERIKKQLSPLSPEAYLALFEDVATQYREKLDRVAPIVEDFSGRVVEERLVEFLLLPFWRHRWFLYELWTLVQVLDTGAGLGVELELEGLEETAPGVVEWRLPGGSASRPVASLGRGEERVLCWTQRKTFHPGTGEGLEPDLRLTTATSGFHDLLIVENKDRRKPPGRELEEIARRYVEGTCAESVWLVNYDRFPAGLERLEERWPGRRVRVVSEFRPGQVPPEFEGGLSELLGRQLGGLGTGPREVLAEDVPEIEVSLTWGARPRDLDLHVWLERDDGPWHVWYREPGGLEVAPHAELDTDARSGSGRETVRIRTEGLRSFKIAVDNFSKESTLGSSGAEVLVRFGDSRWSSFRAPARFQNPWWSVATYDHLSGELRPWD